jgi:delta8-fatty-acid desaturase
MPSPPPQHQPQHQQQLPQPIDSAVADAAAADAPAHAPSPAPSPAPTPAPPPATDPASPLQPPHTASGLRPADAGATDASGPGGATAANPGGARALRIFTFAEVASHCRESDAWLVIDGRVYNVSKWLTAHPGGAQTILNVAGRDCTDVFHVFHNVGALAARLAAFQIGVVRDYAETPLRSDLRRAEREMEAAGIMRTSYRYYAGLALWLAALLTAAMCALASVNEAGATNWPALFAAATLLGVFWQQIAFLGHDFGHNSVFHDRGRDWLGSLLVTALFGVSGQWWKRNHNVHHVSTNSVENDPDIQHLPVLAVSERFFNSVYSTYYRVKLAFNPVAQLLVSYQHRLYHLIMALARYNLYAQSLILVLNPRAPVRRRAAECAALAAFWTWFTLALTTWVPSHWARLAFVLVSHAVAGITHVQITLSHFAQPAYSGRGYNDPDFFFRMQLATSLDIVCPPFLDFVHGGLQFQVAHHVFPRVPRHALRNVTERFLKPLAVKHGVSYHACGFLEANRRVLAQLRRAALKARQLRSPHLGSSLLWRLAMADG